MLGNSVQTPSSEDNTTTTGDDTAGENTGDDGAGDTGDTSGQGESGTTGDTQDGTGTSTYVVDPNTGELIDPATGQPAEMDYGIEGDDTDSAQSPDGNDTNQQ